ncbi:hypothetical protein [Enterococcus sp. AZ062]
MANLDNSYTIHANFVNAKDGYEKPVYEKPVYEKPVSTVSL